MAVLFAGSRAEVLDGVNQIRRDADPIGAALGRRKLKRLSFFCLNLHPSDEGKRSNKAIFSQGANEIFWGECTSSDLHLTLLERVERYSLETSFTKRAIATV
jgi:hypothetical protein